MPKKQEQAGAVLLQYSTYEVEWICIGCRFPPRKPCMASGPSFVVFTNRPPYVTVVKQVSVTHCLACPSPRHSHNAPPSIYRQYAHTFPRSVSFLTGTEVFFLSLHLRLRLCLRLCMLAATSRSAGLVLIPHVAQILPSFPVFDQYLPVAPTCSHAVLPQSVRAHTWTRTIELPGWPAAPPLLPRDTKSFGAHW